MLSGVLRVVGTRTESTSTFYEDGSEANRPGQADHRTRDERVPGPLRRAEERKSEKHTISTGEERQGRHEPRLQGGCGP